MSKITVAGTLVRRTTAELIDMSIAKMVAWVVEVKRTLEWAVSKRLPRPLTKE